MSDGLVHLYKSLRPGGKLTKKPSNFAHLRGHPLCFHPGMWPRVLLAIFIVLQAADGVLTYVAVERFGTQAEGNPLLATWMMLTGAVPALVGAKTMACLCGGLLYVAGVHHVLAGLSVIYLVAAVIPWLRIFATFSF
jgi:hypothetical protein